MHTLKDVVVQIMHAYVSAHPSNPSEPFGVTMLIQIISSKNYQLAVYLRQRIQNKDIAETYQAVQLDAENYLRRQVSMRQMAAVKPGGRTGSQDRNQPCSRSPGRNNFENRARTQSTGSDRGRGFTNFPQWGGNQGKPRDPLKGEDKSTEKQQYDSERPPRKCYNCGSTYHIARNCDKKDSLGKGGEKEKGQGKWFQLVGPGRGRG